MRNIVLVGFMGTGKTVVARALSKKFKLKYVSTDELIERKEKRSISDIFAKSGEEYFRKIEKDTVTKASSIENAVIDTGGGVVKDAGNMENLRSKGVIICLLAKPEVILARTKKCSQRPLLNARDPLMKIKELLAERKPFYDKADHHISTDEAGVEKVACEIERIMNDA